MREDRSYELPELPHSEGGFQERCMFAALDGEIYCLGGVTLFDKSFEVYKLDLAGQQGWKQCDEMEVRRTCFGWGVAGGKIYVCGGIYDEDDPKNACEVYDPEKDVWASIASMESIRYSHHIAKLGGKLFAYGGGCYDDGFIAWRFEQQQQRRARARADIHRGASDWIADASYLEVYTPGKDEWKTVRLFGRQNERLFVAGGKFHLISSSGIHVLDGVVEGNAWTELHSFPDLEVDDFDPYPVLAVGGELLTICNFPDGGDEEELRLLRSTGFGGKTKELVWEPANCFLTFADPPFMCPIQL